MWRRVRFVWAGLWVASAALLVTAGVFAMHAHRSEERRIRAGADGLEYASARSHAADDLGGEQQTLVNAAVRFDDAKALYALRDSERAETQGHVDDRLEQIDGLRNGITAQGLQILDQGTHLNELVVCLEAGERAFNALASNDRGTALVALQSADAECRSSSEFFAERAAATVAPAPSTATTDTTGPSALEPGAVP